MTQFNYIAYTPRRQLILILIKQATKREKKCKRYRMDKPPADHSRNWLMTCGCGGIFTSTESHNLRNRLTFYAVFRIQNRDHVLHSEWRVNDRRLLLCPACQFSGGPGIWQFLLPIHCAVLVKVIDILFKRQVKYGWVSRSYYYIAQQSTCSCIITQEGVNFKLEVYTIQCIRQFISGALVHLFEACFRQYWILTFEICWYTRKKCSEEI